jgi:hypothetical protein
MATLTRRQRILEAIKARLVRIRVEYGSQTDLGLQVYMGEVPTFGPDDHQQILAIIPREDVIDSQQVGKVFLYLPIDVAVVVTPTVAKPWAIVEAGLADIKVAMETGDLSLGGLLVPGRDNPQGMLRGTTEPFPRRSGSDVVGALVTYVCHYAEAIGNPYA